MTTMTKGRHYSHVWDVGYSSNDALRHAFMLVVTIMFQIVEHNSQADSRPELTSVHKLSSNTPAHPAAAAQ
jgi:hypothetical protein